MQEVEEARCGVGGRQVEGVKTRIKGLGGRHSGVISERDRRRENRWHRDGERNVSVSLRKHKGSFFRKRFSCHLFG